MNKIKTALVLIGLMLLIGFAGYLESHDTYQGRVIHKTRETVQIQDTTGKVWEYATTELEKGDTVELIIFNNGTHTKSDDKIAGVR